jgi:hypothetical protein
MLCKKNRHFLMVPGEGIGLFKENAGEFDVTQHFLDCAADKVVSPKGL